LKKKLTILVKLALLVGTLPLLIGHGLGCPDCSDSPPAGIIYDSNTYTLSGGSDITTPISFDNQLSIYDDGKLLWSGETDSPIIFTREVARDEPLNLYVYSSGPASGQLGPLWLHINNGVKTERVKLMDVTVTGPAPFRFIEAHLVVSPTEISTPEGVMGASGSLYVLSGGVDISTPIIGTGHVTIALNDMEMAATSIDNEAYGPISFSAATGNSLTITVDEYPVYSDCASCGLSELWLHLPSGEAVKLAHQTGAIQVNQSNLQSFKAHFVLP
jgi:hypothetical protein